VNGEVLSDITFTPTGSFTTWEQLIVEIELLEGFSEISIVATGESGPNIDSITGSFPFADPIPVASPKPATYDLTTAEQVILSNTVMFLKHDFSTSQNWLVRTVELENTSDEPIIVTSLEIEGPFNFVNASDASGRIIGVGETMSIDISFDSTGLLFTLDDYFVTGALTVNSSDPVTPLYNMPLTGTYLGAEGIRPELPAPGIFAMQNIALNPEGSRPAGSSSGGVGEDAPVVEGEVSVIVEGEARRAIYFEAVDSSQPIVVNQLTSMHNAGGSSLNIYEYSYNPSLGSVVDLGAFTQESLLASYAHDPAWYRTFFPVLTGTEDVHSIEFNAAEGQIFSFILNGAPLGPKSNGSISLQAFKIYDSVTGVLIENTYMFIYDFGGGLGGDWNDNTYVINNI